jgi:hypothetical protein
VSKRTNAEKVMQTLDIAVELLAVVQIVKTLEDLPDDDGNRVLVARPGLHL